MSLRPDVRAPALVVAPPEAPVATGARLRAVLGVGEATGGWYKLKNNAALQNMKKHLALEFNEGMSDERLNQILAALPKQDMKTVFKLAVQIANKTYAGCYSGGDAGTCKKEEANVVKAREIATAKTRWEALEKLYALMGSLIS